MLILCAFATQADGDALVCVCFKRILSLIANNTSDKCAPRDTLFARARSISANQNQFHDKCLSEIYLRANEFTCSRRQFRRPCASASASASANKRALKETRTGSSPCRPQLGGRVSGRRSRRSGRRPRRRRRRRRRGAKQVVAQIGHSLTWPDAAYRAARCASAPRPPQSPYDEL